MRSRQIEVAALLIVLALVALAAGVAALRSRTPADAEIPAAAGRAEPAGVEPGRGAAVYRAECAACHPRAAEVAGSARYAAPGGREALIDLLLAGAVAGDEGAHPDFAHLGDADLAALAGHLLVEWAAPPGAGSPITSEEIAARRRGGAGG